MKGTLVLGTLGLGVALVVAYIAAVLVVYARNERRTRRQVLTEAEVNNRLRPASNGRVHVHY